MARWARVAAWYGERPLMLDATLIGIVTLIAGILRLALLGDIPYGVHPDEAQIGTDAFRVIDEGWIGVYSHAALGVPTLNAYVTAPAVWLLGNTAFTLRLPLALVGLAAIPLTYLLVRILANRTEACIAALLLGVSWWHIFYSRVAHSSISYPTVLLAALVCMALGLQRSSWRWWLAGGALLGLGVYAYNVYPIAFVAVTAWILLLILVRWRAGEPWQPLFRHAALAAIAAFAVALPFIIYISDPDAFYWTHIEDYSQVSITRQDRFQDASIFGKAEIMGEQVREFAATYAWNGREDIIDGNGTRPIFDPVTLALLAGGLLLAWPRRREPMVLLAASCALILPLPALTQTESMMRQPLGAAPFVFFVAALAPAGLWRAARDNDSRVSDVRRWLLPGIAATAVAISALLTVYDYFWTWRDHGLTRFVYHQQITAASEYMDTLPDDAFVYFYSADHPLRLETRQYLARDVRGEDRSYEFSGAEGSIRGINRRNMAVFILLPGYFELLPAIEEAYPGGTVREVYRRPLDELVGFDEQETADLRNQWRDFIAYELPVVPRDGAQVLPP